MRIPNAQIEDTPLEGVLEDAPLEGVREEAQRFHANERPMQMNRRHVKDTKDGTTYTFSTTAAANTFGLNDDTSTVTAFLHAQTVYVNSLDTYCEVNTAIQHADEHLALTQLGMKAGIQMWGQDSVEAIIKEMKQLHDREVVRPLLPNEIMAQVKKITLRYLLFLKKKRNNPIKG